MKGTLTGLKHLKKMAEGQSQGSSFLKLKGGQKVTVRFLQELDSSGKNYDDNRGLAISVYEHSNPDNLRQRFLCTAEEEAQCFGCERAVVATGWKRKARLYVNVYVKDEDEVKILVTGFSSKGVGNSLIEFAEDFGTVGDRWYKLTRQGEGLKTSYSLYPLEVTGFDLAKYVPHDLSRYSTYRSYEEILSFLKGDEPEKKDEDTDW